MSNQAKLEELSRVEGISIDEMVQQGTFDSVALGICCNPNCTYTDEVEPDQDAGYCEICGESTVKSCLILAGII